MQEASVSTCSYSTLTGCSNLQLTVVMLYICMYVLSCGLLSFPVTKDVLLVMSFCQSIKHACIKYFISCQTLNK